MKRHGRLEVDRNPDGTFWIRLRAANGKVLMHSEMLEGRQIRRAKDTIINAFNEATFAFGPECECAACEREAKRGG